MTKDDNIEIKFEKVNQDYGISYVARYGKNRVGTSYIKKDVKDFTFKEHLMVLRDVIDDLEKRIEYKR